jgi:hypothetical protein
MSARAWVDDVIAHNKIEKLKTKEDGQTAALNQVAREQPPAS